MRPLTEEETKIFFEKLSKYIGDNIKQLVDRSDGTYCFRLARERVYYVSENIMKKVSFGHFYVKSNVEQLEFREIDEKSKASETISRKFYVFITFFGDF